MASEREKELRQSAQHRGFRLVKSRRRKPGGDFGKYGLKDADGGDMFGFADGELAASADEIEAYLRRAARSDWKEAAKGLPRRKHAPPPKVRPEARLKKLKVANLLAPLPKATRDEVFTELLGTQHVRIERIVSNGQVTPADAPLFQKADEWVLLLTGNAAIRFEDSVETQLRPGDHLHIPGGTRHWVTHTDATGPTVWLAVHFG